MATRERRSDVFYCRVTAGENERSGEYADQRGTDVSNLTRELYLRTTRDALELRKGFTAERFGHICEELGIS